MNEDLKLEYDENARLVRLVLPDDFAGVLPVATARKLSKIARSGQWKGKQVRRAAVRFPSAESASVNSDALSFLRVECEGPDGRHESGLDFVAREDFGIE